MIKELDSVLLCALRAVGETAWEYATAQQGPQPALVRLWSGGVRGGGLQLVGVPKETSCLRLASKEAM